MKQKIFFSNIGYARGISGSLKDHITRSGTHFYHSPPAQKRVLDQVKDIIVKEDPDLCCFVEIEQGSFFTGFYNQIEALTDDDHHYFDVADKYGGRLHSRLPFHRGKSNGFIAKNNYAYEKIYFTRGAKRLIYRFSLPGGIEYYFAHFSLNAQTRQAQLKEIRDIVLGRPYEAIIMADFNILQGLKELAPITDDGALRLLNKESDYTFTFHKRRLVLDLCLCTAGLVGKIDLKIIPQPFSDHAALLASVNL